MAVKYYIDEKNRTVIAVLKGTRFDAHKTIMKKVGRCEESFFGFTENFNTLIPDSFTGRAKCSESDVWDVEIGKMIAKQKCLEKYYRAKDRAIFTWYKNAQQKMKNMSCLIDDIQKSEKFSEKRKRALENLIEAKFYLDQAVREYELSL